MNNLFEIPETPPEEEQFQPLLEDRGVLIERIVSYGHTTPAGEWLDQDRDEWVALLQGLAILVFEDGSRVELQAGDHLLIPARRRHRVENTSAEPPCIWLAVHGELTPKVESLTEEEA